MTHDELLAKITKKQDPCCFQSDPRAWLILRAVVELHKPSIIDTNSKNLEWCFECVRERIPWVYPCPTIQAIEKELG